MFFWGKKVVRQNLPLKKAKKVRYSSFRVQKVNRYDMKKIENDTKGAYKIKNM